MGIMTKLETTVRGDLRAVENVDIVDKLFANHTKPANTHFYQNK